MDRRVSESLDHWLTTDPQNQPEPPTEDVQLTLTVTVPEGTDPDDVRIRVSRVLEGDNDDLEHVEVDEAGVLYWNDWIVGPAQVAQNPCQQHVRNAIDALRRLLPPEGS